MPPGFLSVYCSFNYISYIKLNLSIFTVPPAITVFRITRITEIYFPVTDYPPAFFAINCSFHNTIERLICMALCYIPKSPSNSKISVYVKSIFPSVLIYHNPFSSRASVFPTTQPCTRLYQSSPICFISVISCITPS